MVGTVADVSPAQLRWGWSRRADQRLPRIQIVFTIFRHYEPCSTNFVTEQFKAKGCGRVLLGDSPFLKTRLIAF